MSKQFCHHPINSLADHGSGINNNLYKLNIKIRDTQTTRWVCESSTYIVITNPRIFPTRQSKVMILKPRLLHWQRP